MNNRVFTAFLVYVLENIPDKKTYQKLVYFAQVLGIPLNHSYKMYFYGPYSETVAEELLMAEKECILIPNGAFSFSAGEQVEEILEAGHEQIENNIDALEQLIDLFGDVTHLNLELYATTHFVNDFQKSLYNNSDKDSIIGIIKKVKGTKFTIEQIEDAYNQLEKWNLP